MTFSPEPLAVTGGRVIDPAAGLDRVADLVIADGRIVGVDAPIPADARRVDATGSIVTPGWMDTHTHVYGDIGLADPDTAGVLAGVTALIDAGSAGALTLDEFASVATAARTDVFSIVHLDRRGIADTTSIPTTVGEIPSVPIGELAQAIGRHPRLVLGVKTGVYHDLGTAWTDLAIAAASMLERPAYFHIGNFPTHSSHSVDHSVHLLDSLRPGDTVTHCYTGAPGNLIGLDGELLPAALEARERGAHFDLGHSGAGFDLPTARRAMAGGLRPDTVSSDLAVINVRQRVRSLAHVLGKVWALGLDLADVIAMVTINPRRAWGLPGGSFASGAPGDVTIAEIVDGPVTFEDCSGNSFTGPGEFRPTGVIKSGVPVDIDPLAVLDPANIRFRLRDEPGVVTDGAPRSVLATLASVLHALPADGEVIQQVLDHCAAAADVPSDVAAAAVRRVFADRDRGNQAGWLIAEMTDRLGVGTVAERMAVAAAGTSPSLSNHRSGAVAR